MSAARKAKAPVIGPTEAFKVNPQTRKILENVMNSTLEGKKAEEPVFTEAHLRCVITDIDTLAQDATNVIEAMARGVLALLQAPQSYATTGHIYSMVEMIAHKAFEVRDNIGAEAQEVRAGYVNVNRAAAINKAIEGGR